MSKNSVSKMNEFDKLNSMKDKLKNSKTLNLSLINKNLIRSNNNSEKNIIKISPRNEIISLNEESKISPYTKNINEVVNKNVIFIDSNVNDTERKEFKYSDTIKNIEQKIIKESDIVVNQKSNKSSDKNINIVTFSGFLESDPQR